MEFSAPLEITPGAGLIKWSPSGKHIAHIYNNNLLIRDAVDLKPEITVPCSEPIVRIEWAPNSLMLFGVCSRRPAIFVWSCSRPFLYATIDCGRSGLVHTRWAPDSSHLLTVSDFSLNCIVWSVNSKEFKYIRTPKSSSSIAFSPDGELLAICDRRDCQDYLTIYSTSCYDPITSFAMPTQDLAQLFFAPNSASVVAVDSALEYRVFSVEFNGSSREYSAYRFQLGIKTIEATTKRGLVAIGSYDQKLRLLSNLTWRVVGECVHPPVMRHSGPAVYQQNTISQDKISRASNYVLASLPFKIPQVKVQQEPNPKIGIGLLAWSPDASLIATRNDNMPTAVWIWDAHTLALLALLNHVDAVKGLEWSPQSSRLAIFSGTHEFFLWSKEGACCVETPIAVQQLKWRTNGNALLLQDKNYFTCCYFVGGQEGEESDE